MFAAAGSAYAAEEAAPAAAEPMEMKISASFSVDLYTHFISYGADVWAGGKNWGNRSIGTVNPTANVTLDFDMFTVNFGTWWDINNNAPTSLGGQFQEVDVWFGFGFNVDKFHFGLLYQDWNYAGDTEKILDGSISYDDTGLIFKDFAFNPSVTFHDRLNAGGAAPAGGNSGLVVVLGIAPGFTLLESESVDLNLSVPVNVGIFTTDDFHGGTQSGVGYCSVGLSLSMPLKFIPEKYGAWNIHGGVAYWITDPDIIPGNLDHDFATGNIGFGVDF
ncbi:MAG: hypothetical protein GC162_08135 [Planctomycetes bacterium]|nr:hypothetical protein [Planctomycetota bacterium]